ncbi:uncharacterized protein LOC128955433 [Oppia nitens]|uniref:uncharacterized protein LOC128955433 n=1 Tax=Oppia nitens TaxID=1686743 RepID=UPI0023D980F0|nr:uncharacterized protein LOC128955433 [Oppia nitens]
MFYATQYVYAQAACRQLDPSAQLVTVDSDDKYQFVEQRRRQLMPWSRDYPYKSHISDYNYRQTVGGDGGGVSAIPHRFSMIDAGLSGLPESVWKPIKPPTKWEDHSLWIGANRQVTSKFQWQDGTRLNYTHWAPGEPNSDGFCVQLGYKTGQGEWYDYNCWSKFKFICEKPQNKTPIDNLVNNLARLKLDLDTMKNDLANQQLLINDLLMYRMAGQGLGAKLQRSTDSRKKLPAADCIQVHSVDQLAAARELWPDVRVCPDLNVLSGARSIYYNVKLLIMLMMITVPVYLYI